MNTIARQLESRVNYRRAIKTAIQATMRAGAEGIKVRISGRLNGADMARSEEFKDGRTPLHTFRADIDYCIAEAQTVYGKIGMKIWICKGEILEKRDLINSLGSSVESNVGGQGTGQRDAKGGGRRDGRRDSRGGGRDNRGGENRGGGQQRGGGHKRDERKND